MSKSTYSAVSRSARMEEAGFDSFESVKKMAFAEQKKAGKIHESMDPKHIVMREARDSDVHPITTPAMFLLDVTGSMLDIPAQLMHTGLPKIVTTCMQAGIKSPAILFGAVGDSVTDEAPLQIGQFESGDAELDMWLTRTWLEAGGGSNAGESYPWAWYFAANHVVTDAWEKRKQKCLLVTCGDEPFLPIITPSEFRKVMGKEIQASLNAADLYKATLERFNTFHIHMKNHRPLHSGWKDVMGQNVIEVNHHDEVPNVFAKLMIENCDTRYMEPIVSGGSGDDGPRYDGKDDDEEPIL